MMKNMDDGIGSIMKTLDDEQLSNNTLVIFTNDNGGERYSDNGGLAKGKSTLWEGGIRVPAFVRWPGKINAGGITQQVAITMDWTCTILSASGAKPGPELHFDGMDLLPILTGKEKNIERTMYWRTSQRKKQKAIREGNWKYLQDEKGEYLFNLEVDQGEKNDLKSQEQAIFIHLKKESDWEKTVLKPIL
jgi:arylsulfatase A-like enzyme